MNAAPEGCAEDLAPGSQVLVYAYVRDVNTDVDAAADVIRWCRRRSLVVMGAHFDLPELGAERPVWAKVVDQAPRMGAQAVLVPGWDHLGADPVQRRARLRAARQAGAPVGVPPPWDRFEHAQRFNGVAFGGHHQVQSLTGGIRYNVTFQVPERPKPPHLLPEPAAPVSSRLDGVLAELDGIEPGDTAGPLVIAITGPAGSGKTAAALHWLHQQKQNDRFPDGDLFADLTPTDSADPMSPSAVLRRWLPALGVPAGDVPSDLDEQAGWYRSLTTGKRLGILLDGALSAAQTRCLIPPGPSVLVVTSRLLLTGLAMDGAHFVHLDESVEAE